MRGLSNSYTGASGSDNIGVITPAVNLSVDVTRAERPDTGARIPGTLGVPAAPLLRAGHQHSARG